MVSRRSSLWYKRVMRKSLKTICIICALLCLSGCRAGKPAKTDRQPADDNYRTVYEIFVGSFCDSNGDGIGDINGIRSKLDYISDLGFDAVWLTPVHPSSTYHKYDVDDFYAIDPAFGTLEDYEALISECHKRGIRVYLDLVLNHTSEDHEWFRAAADYLRELPSGWDPDPTYCKYYDYYNFSREPADGYTQLEGTEWYYEARFWSEMPDLDLGSEAVRGEIRSIIAYWLGKGVDGFRLDAVTSYFQDDTAADTEFLRFLTETARGIDPDCCLIGEAWTDSDTIAALYESGVDSLFDFPFAGPDGIIAKTLRGTYSASYYVTNMIQAERKYGAANPGYVDAPFYTNHDMDRSIEFYPDDDGPAAKMAYAMSLFMTGSAFVYYGEETGMGGAGKDENRRAPMYWSDDAGDPDMCAGPPGMDDVNMRYPSLADQADDDSSIYSWFKELIRVRKGYPAIARGVTEKAGSISDASVAAFYRRSETDDDIQESEKDRDLLIVMNLRAEPAEKDISKVKGKLKKSRLRLAEALTTGEGSITYKKGKLTMPGYSIAVFTIE